MKFKDYLYNNSFKAMIVDMKWMQFLIPCGGFEFCFEHYQSLRILGADDSTGEE